MPRGLVRLHHTGNTHYITFSCDKRRPYLHTPESRDLVEDALERARRKYQFYVAGYVIMPTHVHALLSEPARGTIADVMKCWKLSVTLRRLERPFWEDRYYDRNIFSKKEHVEKLRYIHRNPVRAELVQEPDQWSWSSFEHFATGARRVVEVESQWTARLREANVAHQPGSENPDPGHPHAIE